MFMVGVHNIALAEQSSSILAEQNGAWEIPGAVTVSIWKDGLNAKLEPFIA